jgi:hypothetical protein
VQDQHFCINCGQQVPNPPPKKVAASGGLAVQDNGLPEGVKILPVGESADKKPAHDPEPTPEPAPEPTPEPTPEPAPEPAPAPSDGPSSDPLPDSPKIIKPRARIQLADGEPTDDKAKRKPGRPKAGRLDVPKVISMTAPTAVLPSAPKLGDPTPVPTPAPEPTSPSELPDGPRTMSDIAPRRPKHPETTPDESKSKPTKSNHKKSKSAFSLHLPKIKRHHVHKVGVPPLHFGSVLAFSLRARVRPRLVALAGLAALSFAGGAGYGIWLYLTGGLPHLATQLSRTDVRSLAEAGLLAALYYIGRSVGQAAITYGVIRDADQRPVNLSRQLGVGINTFGRRLIIDVWFAALEIILIALIIGLAFVGGSSWPINPNLQVAALFSAFLVLLYLQTGLALARGLAGVALILTNKSPLEAAKLGWKLFSHRFELLGLRFLALVMEAALALPLAAVAIALIISAPSNLHLAVAFGAAVLAWLAGALFGAGTATWWALLYRRIVLADHSDTAVELLSSRHPGDAKRGALSLIVFISTLLIAAVLALPWLKFF